MVGLADGLAAAKGPEATRLLSEAQVARSPAERRQVLATASRVQAEIEQQLQQLLLRLEEWNDYQDLIQETRALRDRQRDVQGRTEELRGSK
jgi:TolA-binding protein